MKALQFQTPEERTRYAIGMVVSVFVWLGVLISIVGAVYGVFILAFVLVAHALFLAHMTANGVRVGPDQLPHLWRRIEAAAAKLGLKQVPETYVLQSNGILNAFATKLLSRRFVIVNASLLDACESLRPRSRRGC
jgi:Zn-dependent protease with chaperone function